MNAGYRTAAPRPFCVDCGVPLLDAPSAMLNTEGDFVCLQCFQTRKLAETEAAEGKRRRRETIATVVRWLSIVSPLLLVAAMRTGAVVLVAIGILLVGRVIAEVISPSAFRYVGLS